MSMIKKIFLTLLIVFVLVFVVAPPAILTYKINTTMGDLPTPQPAEVSRNGDGHLNSVPIDVRKRILKDIEAYEAEIKRNAKEFAKEFPTSNLLPYSLATDFEPFQTETYTGLRISTRENTGGAHTNLFFRSVTVRDGAQITLSEYLAPKTMTEEKFLEVLNATLAEDGRDQLEGISQITTWNIISETPDVDVVEIMFAPYEVASFAEGPISVRIEVR